MTVRINTSNLALGTNYVGMVEVRSNGGRQGVRIDFSIELEKAAISRYRKKLFWGGFLAGSVFGLLLYTLAPNAQTGTAITQVAELVGFIAFVVVCARAGGWGGGIGAFLLAVFSAQILEFISVLASSAAAWATIVSAFLYFCARRLLAANLAGDRRTQGWVAISGVGLVAIVIVSGIAVGGTPTPSHPNLSRTVCDEERAPVKIIDQSRSNVQTVDVKLQEGWTEVLLPPAWTKGFHWELEGDTKTRVVTFCYAGDPAPFGPWRAGDRPPWRQGSTRFRIKGIGEVFFFRGYSENSPHQIRDGTASKTDGSNETHPASSPAAGDLVQAAEALFARREYNDAIATCDRALQFDPRNQAALQLRTRISQTMQVLGIKPQANPKGSGERRPPGTTAPRSDAVPERSSLNEAIPRQPVVPAQSLQPVPPREQPVVSPSIPAPILERSPPGTARRIQDVVWTLDGCRIGGYYLLCNFGVTNQGVERNVQMATWTIRLVDSAGQEHHPSRLVLGGKNCSGNCSLDNRLPTGVPFAASLGFDQIPENSVEVRLLEVSCCDLDKPFQFRGVPVTR